MGLRAIKKRVLEVLAGIGPLPEVEFTDGETELPDGREGEAEARLAGVVAELAPLPRSRVLKVLFALLCHNEPALRWRAVSLMGPLVADLAEYDMEAARVVMRRLMWSLNDESGGIGWGAPEAMAECLAHHSGLAEEYTHILVSFMREDGFFLEYPPLQRGLMWALGRLAMVRPHLLGQKNAQTYLLSYLDSPDPPVRGLAARALGILQVAAARQRLSTLLGQSEPVVFYGRERLLVSTVGDLAAAALARLSDRKRSQGTVSCGTL